MGHWSVSKVAVDVDEKGSVPSLCEVQLAKLPDYSFKVDVYFNVSDEDLARIEKTPADSIHLARHYLQSFTIYGGGLGAEATEKPTIPIRLKPEIVQRLRKPSGNQLVLHAKALTDELLTDTLQMVDTKLPKIDLIDFR